MDRAHTNPRVAEKEQVKEMLRDAIRILCQSTVTHHAKLSVEALIGITVDDGEHAIIVNINETINKADDIETENMHQQHMEADYADTSYLGSKYDGTTNADGFQPYDSLGYSQQSVMYGPGTAVVKKETSVITYNVGQPDGYPHTNTNTAHAANPHFADSDSYPGYEGAENYGQQVPNRVPRGQNVRGSAPKRGRGRDRGRGRGAQNPSWRSHQSVSNYGNVTSLKHEPSEKVDTTTGGNATPGRKRSLIESGEVEHLSVYTCQRCGKQFTLYSSFLRHKKSHLGIIYRCDACGKIVSRSDHLAAHRRKCELALQQAPLDC